MLELGKKSKYYHQQAAKILNKTNIDKVFCFIPYYLKTDYDIHLKYSKASRGIKYFLRKKNPKREEV